MRKFILKKTGKTNRVHFILYTTIEGGEVSWKVVDSKKAARELIREGGFVDHWTEGCKRIDFAYAKYIEAPYLGYDYVLEKINKDRTKRVSPYR